VRKNGYPIEFYSVTTADCYILQLHRIPFGKKSPKVKGQKRPVVYLQHGLFCSSDDWVISSPDKSLRKIFFYFLSKAWCYFIYFSNFIYLFVSFLTLSIQIQNIVLGTLIVYNTICRLKLMYVDKLSIMGFFQSEINNTFIRSSAVMVHRLTKLFNKIERFVFKRNVFLSFLFSLHLGRCRLRRLDGQLPRQQVLQKTLHSQPEWKTILEFQANHQFENNLNSRRLI